MSAASVPAKVDPGFIGDEDGVPIEAVIDAAADEVVEITPQADQVDPASLQNAVPSDLAAIDRDVDIERSSPYAVDPCQLVGVAEWARIIRSKNWLASPIDGGSACLLHESRDRTRLVVGVSTRSAGAPGAADTNGVSVKGLPGATWRGGHPDRQSGTLSFSLPSPSRPELTVDIDVQVSSRNRLTEAQLRRLSAAVGTLVIEQNRIP